MGPSGLADFSSRQKLDRLLHAVVT